MQGGQRSYSGWNADAASGFSQEEGLWFPCTLRSPLASEQDGIISYTLWLGNFIKTNSLIAETGDNYDPTHINRPIAFIIIIVNYIPTVFLLC